MSQRIDKAWGWEEVIVNNDLYCGKLLHLNAGAVSSTHSHRYKHETFYVLRGRVRILVGGNGYILWEGQSVGVPPKTLHRFQGLEDSVIIEFSTPHSDSDVYRITASKPAPKEQYGEALQRSDRI